MNILRLYKKILGMASQPPLTHLTKTLTMKKFYIFQVQSYGFFSHVQIFLKKNRIFAVNFC